jgi:hypothetical protein
MAEPADMIVPLLREMRAEMSTYFDRVDDRFNAIERRLKALEEIQVSYRRRATES